MPTAPLRPCPGNGGRCRARTHGGPCLEHRRERERFRGSRQQRGYDRDWEILRNWFMAQPENQLCVLCRAEGRVERATDADHIIPFQGRQDPRRLDLTNLQPVCGPHNSRKVHQDARRAHHARPGGGL